MSCNEEYDCEDEAPGGSKPPFGDGWKFLLTLLGMGLVLMVAAEILPEITRMLSRSIRYGLGGVFHGNREEVLLKTGLLIIFVVWAVKRFSNMR